MALAAAAYLLWRWANDMSGVRREPKVSAIIPLPPPPPPPPEPEKPPEPEQPKEEQQPEPEPVPTPEPPKPQDEAPPRPADDLANPMQIDGDAQAGNDAFNIGAGQGMSAAAAARRQRHVQPVPRLRAAEDPARGRAHPQPDLPPAGQHLADGERAVTRVELTKSSGDADVDARVVAALRAVPALDERPPASVSMPIRASLTGRRPS